MLRYFVKQGWVKLIVEQITKEMNISLNLLQQDQNKKFNKIIDHLGELQKQFTQLEERLTSKELKDKIDYGQMQYKIQSLQQDLKPKKKKPHNLEM